MISIFARTWRILVKRAAHDWLMLTAAVITVMMASTLLAAGPIYADAVTLSSLQRTLHDAPTNAANLSISLNSRPGRFDRDDRIVVEQVGESVKAIDYEILRQIDSESYQLDASPGEGATRLVVFRFMEGVEAHAILTTGDWPADTTQVVEVVVPVTVAEPLGIVAGDELEVTNRQDRSHIVHVRVSGTYEVDAEDPFWFDDSLALSGSSESSSFVTYGPLLTTEESLISSASPIRARYTWRVFPDFTELTVPEISPLRNSVTRLEERLNNARDLEVAAPTPEAVRFEVETGLAALLASTDRSLVVTRAGVLMLSVQLAVLAGYALVLTAGLLIDIRRTETNLLRSRGGGNGQLLVAAVLEGLLLTVPAAIAAPTLAALALRALTKYGPLASIGLELTPEPQAQAYLLASVAAVGCILALALPTYRSARSFADPRVGAGRQSRASGWQSAGVDIALLILAALAFWQLSEHGADITSAVRGRLGIDPMLVSAPALGLLAGGVLALRTIPWLARLAERMAAAGTATVPALSAWQVARRPARYARSALLLIMAVSIGLFAASYTTTWRQSQDDQADFQIGSDIRVSPDQRIGQAMPDLVLSDAYSALPGVSASLPVAVSTAQLSRTDPTLARFVMLDAAKAANVVALREDLGGAAFPEVMDRLVSARPEMAGVAIPGEPRRLAMTASIELEPHGAEIESGVIFPNVRPVARLILQDGDGLLHRLDLGNLEPEVGPITVDVPVVFTAPDGEVFSPTYPLSLVDIVFYSPAPTVTRRFSLTIHRIHAAADRGGTRWTDVDLGSASWDATNSEPIGVFQPASIRLDEPADSSALSVTAVSGSSSGESLAPVYFSVRPEGTRLPETFPVVVTNGFLEATTSESGDVVALQALHTPRNLAQIVGTIEQFPTVEPGSAEVVLVDLPTSQIMGYTLGVDPPSPTEYWIDTDGPSDLAAAELRTEPYHSFSLRINEERARTLKSDPIALGTIASLSLGFIAAAVFAAVGFTVSATVSARERVTEFALLRALGLSNRQLGSWLAIEQGALVGVSLFIGTAVGIVLCMLILPLVAITQTGESVVPDLQVVLPADSIVTLELVVVASLVGIVVVLALLLRRLGLGSLLRMGED